LGDPAARNHAAAAEGVMGTVVSRLDVPGDIAAAVDAALGMWSDAFATDGPGILAEVAGGLKSEGLGGVTLVVGHTHPGAPVARPIAAQWGGDALIDRLGSSADRGLAHRLLGDVVVVEGWATAWRLVEQHPDVRAVTPEGDVVSIHGIRLADADGAGHAALEAARVALEIAETEAARNASHLTTARRAFEAARTAERSALETLERLEARLAGHTEALGLNGRGRAEGEAELVRLDERARALATAATVREQRTTELRSRLADFEGEEQERQAAWDALNARRTEVARRRDEARRRREEATAALAGAEERRRMLGARLEATADELGVLEATPHDPGFLARLGEVESRARTALTLVRGHLETLRDRQRRLRDETNAAAGHVDDADRRQGQLADRVSGAKDRASTLAVEIAELRVRDESVAEALRRDADAAEDEALAAARPDLPPGVDAREELSSREAELRRMGPINPLAAAEYQELAAHVELLETQLADLDESRRELEKVISALDTEMATLFMAAFDEIAERYEENFGLVFPGGRGRIRLTDPDRPLETGVEIEAQPLGKKVGRLSLLSGGERSLAALAFLFAVFRARPSPFYVLDEVEAALDDANLRRFLRLVDTLRDRAQLVIITHQQQTMEAGDILYGVTMEPASSSKVLSKRMAPVRH
jgi:chromosome segregation protein